MRRKPQIARRRQYTRQFYHQNHLSFGLAVLSSLLVASVNLVLTWMIQQMIDTASGLPGAFSLKALICLTVCVILLILAFKGLSYLSHPRFIKRAMQQYKAFAFSQLMQKNIASFHQEPTARYLSALSNDASSIEENYLAGLFNLILNGVLFAGSLGMMLVYRLPGASTTISASRMASTASGRALGRLGSRFTRRMRQSCSCLH